METLGKYKILEKIGEGGMGRVYKAVDPVLDRKVAIKVIAFSAATDHQSEAQQLRDRFIREARLVGSLQHKNIVTLFDFGEFQGTVYMVMEFLDGTDLKKAIKSGASASLARKIDIFRQVCEGLAYGHSRDVIHRDIKPGNIHLLESGVVKIVDFGLARMSDSNMTASGVVLGTPDYMSPEQIRGQRVDGRADLFSLGAVMYEFFTGQRPFRGDTISALLANILTTDPAPARMIDASVPSHLEGILQKCLCKEPGLRYQDASAVLRDLDSLVRSIEERRDVINRYGVSRSSMIKTDKLVFASPEEDADTRSSLPRELPEAAPVPRSRSDYRSERAATLPSGIRGRWSRVLLGSAGAVVLAIIAASAYVAFRETPGQVTEPVKVQEVKPMVPEPETGPAPAPRHDEAVTEEVAGASTTGTTTSESESIVPPVPQTVVPQSETVESGMAPSETALRRDDGQLEQTPLDKGTAETPQQKPPPPDAKPAEKPVPRHKPQEPVEKPMPKDKPQEPSEKPVEASTTPAPGEGRRRWEPVEEPGPPPLPATGSLSVKILLPAGVRPQSITIDGDPVVMADPAGFVQEGLPVGPHTIRVECEGYEPYVSQVRIAPERPVQLIIDFTRRQRLP
ncbi:MAG: serine/threonine-protein kinase [Acidobacteriota bacterium]